jgi:hypothetical protein
VRACRFPRCETLEARPALRCSTAASSVDVNTPPALTGWNAWQNCLAVDRADLGATIQSGYFYVLSGITTPLTPPTVTNTIEYTLY